MFCNSHTNTCTMRRDSAPLALKRGVQPVALIIGSVNALIGLQFRSGICLEARVMRFRSSPNAACGLVTFPPICRKSSNIIFPTIAWVIPRSPTCNKSGLMHDRSKPGRFHSEELYFLFWKRSCTNCACDKIVLRHGACIVASVIWSRVQLHIQQMLPDELQQFSSNNCLSHAQSALL